MLDCWMRQLSRCQSAGLPSHFADSDLREFILKSGVAVNHGQFMVAVAVEFISAAFRMNHSISNAPSDSVASSHGSVRVEHAVSVKKWRRAGARFEHTGPQLAARAGARTASEAA